VKTFALGDQIVVIDDADEPLADPHIAGTIGRVVKLPVYFNDTYTIRTEWCGDEWPIYPEHMELA
jgi:hypothetical protein